MNDTIDYTDIILMYQEQLEEDRLAGKDLDEATWTASDGLVCLIRLC